MDQPVPEIIESVNQELACRGCGATLDFSPGTTSLKCNYCGAENPITLIEAPIEEIDYEAFIAKPLEESEQIHIRMVKCPGCGAQVTLEEKVTADACPYCDTRLVISEGGDKAIVKPRSLVPFAIDKKKSSQLFHDWIAKLWFAPGDLKERVAKEAMDGMYVPYWTYDAQTTSQYTGLRGTYYYVTEHYTTQENGRTVNKTRQVRKTSWAPCAGVVDVPFDDVLVPATKSLPDNILTFLPPWNLGQLIPYDDRFLSGFRCEAYGIDVKEGLNDAKVIMGREIEQSIRRDIGGDEQRILTTHSKYDQVTFKHVLLPVWISSYRYKNKVFRFLVNGQSGKVKGERPYSIMKILGLILAVAAVVIGIIIIAN
jgi:LSD1 subclass zinc finger protein